MQRYILGRLAQAVLLLVLITMLVSSLTLLVPGGPLAQYADDPRMSAADLQQLRQYYGLDQPAPVRYVRWLGVLLRGLTRRSEFATCPII